MLEILCPAADLELNEPFLQVGFRETRMNFFNSKLCFSLFLGKRRDLLMSKDKRGKNVR